MPPESGHHNKDGGEGRKRRSLFSWSQAVVHSAEYAVLVLIKFAPSMWPHPITKPLLDREWVENKILLIRYNVVLSSVLFAMETSHVRVYRLAKSTPFGFGLDLEANL